MHRKAEDWGVGLEIKLQQLTNLHIGINFQSHPSIISFSAYTSDGSGGGINFITTEEMKLLKLKDHLNIVASCQVYWNITLLFKTNAITNMLSHC